MSQRASTEPTELVAGDRWPDYPSEMCWKCGEVAPDRSAGDRHAAECDGPPSFRPVTCGYCATQTWRSPTCRSCGRTLRGFSS